MTARLFRCPACSASLKVPETVEGKKIKCPKCSESVTVSFGEDTPPSKPEPKDERPARRQPERDEDETRDEDRDKSPRRRSKKTASNSGLIWGCVAGGVLALIGVVVLVFAFSGGSEQPKKQAAVTTPSKAAPNGTAPINTVPKDTPKVETSVKPPVQNSVTTDPPVKTPQVNQPKVIPPTPKDEPEPVFVPVIDKRPPDLPDVPLPSGKDRPFLVTDPGGHSAVVKACMFTPDGEQVVTISSDKSVRVWDWRTGETARVFRLPMGVGHEGQLMAADVSPDGKWLAVGGHPFGKGKFGVMIHILSLESGQVEKVLRGHTNSITAVAFSHDSRYLASASFDNTCRLWDLASGQTAKVFQGHTGAVRNLAFSHDDKLLATASIADKSVRLWSVANGATLAELRSFTNLVLSVAWSPLERTLAVGIGDGTIHLFTDAGKPIRNYKISAGEDIQVVNLRFSPDGKEIVYGGVQFKGNAGIFNLDKGKQRVVFKEHGNTVMDVRYSKDGQLVVSSGGDDQETFVWKSADGAVAAKLMGIGKTVWGLGWRKDGKAFGWGNTNKLDARELNAVEHSFVFEDLDFGPPPEDFGRVARSMNGYALQRVDFFSIAIFKDGQRLHVFGPSKVERLYSFTLIGGNRAAFGGSEHLYIVDLPTNKIIRKLEGHSGIVFAVSPSPDGRYLLSGGSDQTICLWDTERKDPLLSFFVAGREWIAWTPQGYYAASPNGERLMGWLINNGPDQLASYHPAARFHDSLYNPDVIKYVFQEKNLAKAMAMAAKKGDQPAAIVNVTKVLPPKVTIVSPKELKAVVKDKVFEVRAKAESVGGHPVTGMRLFIDGRPYNGDKGLRQFAGDKAGEVEATWKIVLLPGTHQMTVMAESKVSKGQSSPCQIVWFGNAPKEPANLYVLAAGVSAYPDPDMKLAYAHKDAIAIDKVFREKTKGLFKKVETRLLTDEKATRQNIVDGLKWLEGTMTQRDVAIVFLAGHGSRDPRGQFHFIPVDVKIDDPDGTCVSGAVLKKSLYNMPGRVVAMLDACHSGTTADEQKKDQKKVAADKAKKAAADGLVRDLVSEEYGVVTMCSSLGREYSLESKSVGHGFFTLSLVEALTGRADFNNDGYVYIHELDFYAFNRVRQLSQGQQNPTTGRPPNIRSFPLAKLR